MVQQICQRPTKNSKIKTEGMEQIQRISSLDGIHQREKHIQLINGIPQTANDNKENIDCGRDSKQLFSMVNAITDNKQMNPLPDNKTQGEMANDFADFFIRKIQTTRGELSSANEFKPQVNNIPKLS